MNKAAVIICTRPESSRIPGKCFRRIAGKPALDHLIERLLPAGLPIILAIPKGSGDEYMTRLQQITPPLVHVFEGDADSPLRRMAGALIQWEKELGNPAPDYVIRITHDDILIDTKTMTDLLAYCIERGAGYGTTPGIVEGAGVEVIAAANVLYADSMHTEPIEHLSYFVKGPTMPNPTSVTMQARTSIRRQYRLTMDYPEDVVVLEAIFRDLGPMPSVDAICEYLDMNTHLLGYNRLPMFTVYTCAHNAERFINQTILNVLLLPDDIEYIVVDDGSTDGTLNEIMRCTGSERDPRLKVIVNEENIGLASSCNRALDRARGRYIIRVDADDLIMQNALSKMRNAMDSEGVAICYSAYHELGEDGMIRPGVIPGDRYHHAGCALMDTRLIRQIKFTEGLKHWDSLDLYNRIKNKFQVVYEKSPLWLYRQVPTSLSHQRTRERRAAKKEIAQ